MRRIVLGVLSAAYAAGGFGCAAMQALQTAGTATQTATDAVQTATGAVQTAGQAAAQAASAAIAALPADVQQIINSVISQNQLQWGSPQTIVVTPEQYVILYPTPQSELQQGQPRMIVIYRQSRLASLGVKGVP